MAESSSECRQRPATIKQDLQLDRQQVDNNYDFQSIQQNPQESVPMLMADLQNIPKQKPTITFGHQLNQADTIRSQQLPIRGFCFMPETHSGEPSVATPDISKAFAKGQKVVAKLSRFLHNPNSRPVFNVNKGQLSKPQILSSTFKMTGRALVGGPPVPGHARDIEGVSSFHEVVFGFPHAAQLAGAPDCESSHLMHFSCPTLKSEDRLFGGSGEMLYDSVNIVSGVCLYNSHILNGPQDTINDPQTLASRLSCQSMTLYEMDYISRASTAIADIAAHIMQNHSNGRAHPLNNALAPLRINLDVPSFHYYHMMDVMAVDGRCSSSEVLCWMDSVEKRSTAIATVFKHSILHTIANRLGSSDHRPQPQFYVSPGADSIVAFSIREALQRGIFPSFELILRKLQQAGDHAWKNFWSLLAVKDYPQDFRGLGYLFYVFQCVRPALVEYLHPEQYWDEAMSTTSSDGDALSTNDSGYGTPTQDADSARPRRLLISVDDGAERKIYSRAQKLLKCIRRGPADRFAHAELLEVYLARRVFINGNESGSNLYLDDPTPETLKLRYTTKSQNGSWAREFQAGSTLNAEDIATVLYGREQVELLRSWYLSAVAV